MSDLNNKQPIFICIEGLDGSGKNLQTNMLTEKLREKGYNVTRIDFPQYDSFFGKEIGAYLSGRVSTRADQIDAKSMSLWYAMDRWDKLKGMRLDSFDFVIFDRYTLSNAIYQSSRIPTEDRTELVEWIFRLEHDHLSLPIPDLYIFLDVPPEISRKLNESKGYRGYVGNTGDIYEKDANLQQSVRASYLEASKTLDNMRVITCVENDTLLPPETISERIWYNVRQRAKSMNKDIPLRD